MDRKRDTDGTIERSFSEFPNIFLEKAVKKKTTKKLTKKTGVEIYGTPVLVYNKVDFDYLSLFGKR